MKILIAIDSMKGSLSSLDGGKAIADGVHRVFPDAECEVRPLADGGEGTLDALVAGLGGAEAGGRLTLNILQHSLLHLLICVQIKHRGIIEPT